MYEHALCLIAESYTEDEWGNQTPIERRTNVLCKLKCVGRQEFYAAAQTGLRPELIFVVHGYEYNGETTVEFEGKKYKVLRTYQKDFEELELVCGEVIGHG